MIRIPEELVKDAEEFDLEFFAEALRHQLAREPVPVIEPQADVVDRELWGELFVGVLEDLELADGEGLGAPWDEEAGELVDWMLEKVSEHYELLAKGQGGRSETADRIELESQVDEPMDLRDLLLAGPVLIDPESDDAEVVHRLAELLGLDSRRLCEIYAELGRIGYVFREPEAGE